MPIEPEREPKPGSQNAAPPPCPPPGHGELPIEGEASSVERNIPISSVGAAGVEPSWASIGSTSMLLFGRSVAEASVASASAATAAVVAVAVVALLFLVVVAAVAAAAAAAPVALGLALALALAFVLPPPPPPPLLLPLPLPSPLPLPLAFEAGPTALGLCSFAFSVASALALA